MSPQSHCHLQALLHQNSHLYTEPLNPTKCTQQFPTPIPQRPSNVSRPPGSKWWSHSGTCLFFSVTLLIKFDYILLYHRNSQSVAREDLKLQAKLYVPFFSWKVNTAFISFSKGSWLNGLIRCFMVLVLIYIIVWFYSFSFSSTLKYGH